ncbi:thioredoxin domain-containing protein 3 [Octodon degus]|uniref:Thioredoxin domain-containing protein 3 n=1 Tax=Octodon degus TaxID=10160 RepID=A0A6P6EAM1_OCTDE|nr:thioredoxin domain-containing protein 3 [Octodon degus]
MASKKQGEVQLQTVINSQSLWEEMLQNKGLTVIDVYQAWCGPCKAMQPLFRKLKTEINEDEILHFVVAEADNIVSLQSYRDKCEPLFLFSVNGKVIAKIQGANAPLVNKKVIALINEEKKIAAGEMVRPQYPDILLIDSVDHVYSEIVFSLGEMYSIAVIKPDAVLKAKAQEIKEKIITAGFVIEAEERAILTEEQVRDFYSQTADQPDFEEFLSFMITGLSYVLLIVQGKGQSPKEESEIKAKESPELSTEYNAKKWNSLQECLEQQHLSQFCDVEDNEVNVTRLTDVFFPEFKINKGKKLQRTMALLRPDLLEKQDDIFHIIKDEGFKILMERQIVLSEEEAKMLCEEFENKSYFEKLIENMTRQPSLALVLLRENCVQYWKELLGPRTTEEISDCHTDSLCAQFAVGSLPINQLYGSDSAAVAERDIQCFFPLENTFALIKPHVTREQRGEILKLIKDEGFELVQMKDLLLTPEQVGKIYFQITTKDFYNDVLEVLSEGPSLIMVLSKWNAITDWRRLMGPVDPEEAKLLSPQSIRAQFGTSILKNAVHGSTNHYSVTENINTIFGDDMGEQ